MCNMLRTEEWIQHPEQFVPAWKGIWEPAPGMLDFEEKWEAFHTPTGRLMVCAHRGENNIYYPENSLEGIFSAIKAGADIVEIDLHTTKDGQIVIMHDPTLTRTTNVSKLRDVGETWMPESDLIAEWTLEQIRRLRLVTKEGEETLYAVPTLREVIQIAKNRVFVTLDKIDCFQWDDVYELIKEQRAYRTVLIPYNYKLEKVYEIQCQVRRETGYNLPFFAGVVKAGGIWTLSKLYGASAFLKVHHMPAILRGGYHNLEDVERLKPVIDELKKDHRIYAESMGINRDKPEVWQSMLDMGYNIFMGNKLYDHLQIVKDRHFSN